jgi:uncharacterized 2Fe-2S/4Fe-4S cluster protein (DUF4445 family)
VGDLIHEGRRTPLVTGRSLFDYADDLAVVVPASCRRTGRCHECVVEVRAGLDALSPRTEPEEFLRDPYRLACQAAVVEAGADVEIAVLRRRLRIVTRASGEVPHPDPVVTRDGDRVLYAGEPLDVWRGALRGVAIDLGTTTIAWELLDLPTGEVLHVGAIENPQRFGGSDVISRIAYDEGEHRGELRQSVRKAVNHELKETYAALGIDRRTVYEVVVVGNATMRDLFFGLDVSPIGARPFRSVVETEYRAGLRRTTEVVALAHALGILAHPQARIVGGPLIGSHVGADISADLAATGFADGPEPAMLIDVGTNTEVVVRAGDRYLAASCPAGPAFEGGSVRHGMAAAVGAIESVASEDGRLTFRTIGDVPPVGICGSGLVDLLAELTRTGAMTPEGRFAGGSVEIPIAPDEGISFSRADASALAQAKAANHCGTGILLRLAGLVPGDLRRLYLAGAFASYIDVANAIDIGFIPPVAPDRVDKVGNASLRGARIMLLSGARRADVDALVRRIEHVELETHPDFFDLFVEGCRFAPIEI